MLENNKSFSISFIVLCSASENSPRTHPVISTRVRQGDALCVPHCSIENRMFYFDCFEENFFALLSLAIYFLQMFANEKCCWLLSSQFVESSFGCSMGQGIGSHRDACMKNNVMIWLLQSLGENLPKWPWLSEQCRP